MTAAADAFLQIFLLGVLLAVADKNVGNETQSLAGQEITYCP